MFQELPTSVATVNSSAAYVLLGRWQLAGRGMILRGSVAGAALAHLQLKDGVVQGGTNLAALTDTDFNTASELLPESTQNPHLTAAGSSFTLRVGTGRAEVELWAQKTAGQADAVVTLIGAIV